MSNKTKELTHLENIADLYLPEKIKRNRFLSDVIEIFCKVTDYYNPYPVVNFVANVDQKILDREAVTNTYINELYNTIKSAMQDSRVARKMRELGGSNGTTTLSDIQRMLNNEYLWVSRIQKTTKGLGKNIAQAYNTVVATKIQTAMKDNFEIIEIEPFRLMVKGGLVGEIYEATVKPLTHPLGFGVDYFLEIKIVDTDTVFDIYADDENFILNFNSSLVWNEFLDPSRLLDKFDALDFLKKRESHDMFDTLLDDDFFACVNDATDEEIKGPDLIIHDIVSQRHIAEDNIEIDLGDR